MAMLLMDKKKSPAAIIVSSMRNDSPEDSLDRNYQPKPSMDHLKLAAYELADKAGFHIEDMDGFIRAMCMFHKYMHEDMDDNPGHSMGGY